MQGSSQIEVLHETRRVFSKADTSTTYSLCPRIDRKKEKELMTVYSKAGNPVSCC